VDAATLWNQSAGRQRHFSAASDKRFANTAWNVKAWSPNFSRCLFAQRPHADGPVWPRAVVARLKPALYYGRGDSGFIATAPSNYMTLNAEPSEKPWKPRASIYCQRIENLLKDIQQVTCR
jgi:hypothetical protein